MAGCGARRSLLHRTQPARGVVLLVLLLTLMLGAIGAMAAVDVYATARQREQEAELLFVGEQYRQAIRRYYFGAPPGQVKALPLSLQDLLEDRRYPQPVRHLRRLYLDPMTPEGEWALLMQDNRIVGVHSLSRAHPLKQKGFAAAQSAFEGRTSYAEWEFHFRPTGR